MQSSNGCGHVRSPLVKEALTARRGLARRTAASAQASAWAGEPSASQLVFLGLEGDWQFSRTIVSRRASEPSGVVTGTCSFSKRASSGGSSGGAVCAANWVAERDPDHGGIDAAAEYFYLEQGVFKLASGPSMRARRTYIYAWDEERGRVSLYFAKADGSRDYLFHHLNFNPNSLEFKSTNSRLMPLEDAPLLKTASAILAARKQAPNASKPACPCGMVTLIATGQHPCDRDMHYGHYSFVFAGHELICFRVFFHVTGPEVEYSTDALFSR